MRTSSSRFRRGGTAILAAALAFGLSACSGRDGAASFDGVFEKLARARDFNEAKRYYTDGTVKALEEAGGGSGKAALRLLPLFDERTKWEEVSKRVEGPRGVIRIRYSAHPVENMVGFEMEFQVRKIGDSWKIDLENEVRGAIEARGKGSAAEYIRGVTRGY